MSATQVPATGDKAAATTFSIIAAISFCHLLNDMMQSLLPAIYPILRDNYALDFSQIGLLTFTFQFTASLLQPVVGLYTDRKPQPYSLPAGMGFTLIGLLILSGAGSYPVLLLGAALIGTGSAVLHPESSRVARMASGGRHGLAQSLFSGRRQCRLGARAAARGLCRAALRSNERRLVSPRPRCFAMLILFRVGHWYKDRGARAANSRRQ